jgi:hypothetical protein
LWASASSGSASLIRGPTGPTPRRPWLGDVVVAAGRQASNLVGRGVACAEEQNRDVCALVGQALGDLKPIHVGQHHVEHEHVRAPFANPRERAGATIGGIHVESVVAQRHRYDIDDIRFVVNDKHAQAVLLADHRA